MSSTQIEERKPLSWYWWFRGKYLSDTPPNWKPSSDDILEQLAWASIKYDHLGGPNTNHVVLTYLKPGELKNPNNAWDMSKSAAPFMRRVFQLENWIHFLTIIMHFIVLLPLTTTYFLTSNKSAGKFLRFLRKVVPQIKK